MSKHEATTRHTWISDDGEMAVSVELENGPTMTIDLKFKSAQIIDLAPVELLELAAIAQQAAAFIAELGLRK